MVRPNTYGNWLIFRGYLVDGSPKPAVEAIKKSLKIYQLAEAASPPPMNFANASGVPANFVFPTDYSYWNLLNQVIQEEPSTGSDPTTLGLFASIGIVKGKAFDPDPRMKKILEDAANIGAVTARAITYKLRSQDAYYYPKSAWRLPFLGGYKFEVAPGVSNLDGAINFFYLAGGVTPAMEAQMVGQGSQYPWAVRIPRAILSTAPGRTSSTFRPTCRPKTSGRSSFTTTRRAGCSRPTSGSRASAVTART